MQEGEGEPVQCWVEGLELGALGMLEVRVPGLDRPEGREGGHVHAVVVDEFDVSRWPDEDVAGLDVAVRDARSFQDQGHPVELLLQGTQPSGVLVLLLDVDAQGQSVGPVHADCGVAVLLDADAGVQVLEGDEVGQVRGGDGFTDGGVALVHRCAVGLETAKRVGTVAVGDLEGQSEPAAAPEGQPP